MTNKEKAILDMIAYAEGTLGVSQNGYDIAFDHRIIVGWIPETTMKHGGLLWKEQLRGEGKRLSTVGGRYQFKQETWVEVVGDIPFNKNNQDIGALKLLNSVIKMTIREKKSVNIETMSNKNEFIILLNKIASTWASIPYEYNGFKSYYKYTDDKGEKVPQPSKSVDELYTIYNKALDLYGG
jgi:muramidase (phage lysozyme)